MRAQPSGELAVQPLVGGIVAGFGRSRRLVLDEVEVPQRTHGAMVDQPVRHRHLPGEGVKMCVCVRERERRREKEEGDREVVDG
jgi:hypothetical protein